MNRLAASILVVALPACSGGEEAPPPGRGVGDAPGAQTPPQLARDRDNPLVRPEHDTRARPELMKAGPRTIEIETRPDKQGTEPSDDDPRDYAGELRALAGDPISCVPVDAVPPATQQVRIDLEANVTETGVVTRAYATARGLPADALDCLRSRVERGRFAAPVRGAPRSIRATLELRRRAPPPAPP